MRKLCTIIYTIVYTVYTIQINEMHLKMVMVIIELNKYVTCNMY